MGRVIKIESAGKDRTQLMRSIALGVRELTQQQEVNMQVRDLCAFITIALEAISNTIDDSVNAWEKRGYWLKADKFRLEWAWTIKLSGKLRAALSQEDWPNVAQTIAQVAEKVKNVHLPQRTSPTTPWMGAWDRFLAPDKRNKVSPKA